jgi:hypothetical protein
VSAPTGSGLVRKGFTSLGLLLLLYELEITKPSSGFVVMIK